MKKMVLAATFLGLLLYGVALCTLGVFSIGLLADGTPIRGDVEQSIPKQLAGIAGLVVMVMLVYYVPVAWEKISKRVL